MTSNIPWAAAAFALLWTGCAADIEVTEPKTQSFATPEAPVLDPSEEAPRLPGALFHAAHFAAWASDGSLAIARADTGALEQRAEGAGLGGVRDIAFDRFASRLITFESDEDDGWGVVASYPLNHEGALGDRKDLASIDGDARVWATPLGVLLFEESQGSRWRGLWNDGAPGSSAPACRPASILEIIGKESTFRAFCGASSTAAATVQIGTMGDHTIELGSSWSVDQAEEAPRSARLVSTTSGDVLLEITETTLTATIMKGETRVASSALEDEVGASSRIETAIAQGNGGTVALLLSAPARVIALRLGDGGAIVASASLDLEGDVRVENRFFSREFIAVGPSRFLAATSSGVVAISLDEADDEGASIALRRDDTFDGAALRGPMALLAD